MLVLTYQGNNNQPSTCLFVCPRLSKTVEPIGPKFCKGPHMTPGKVYGCQNYKNLSSKNYDFRKFEKKPGKLFLNLRT